MEIFSLFIIRSFSILIQSKSEIDNVKLKTINFHFYMYMLCCLRRMPQKNVAWNKTNHLILFNNKCVIWNGNGNQKGLKIFTCRILMHKISFESLEALKILDWCKPKWLTGFSFHLFNSAFHNIQIRMAE